MMKTGHSTPPIVSASGTRADRKLDRRAVAARDVQHRAARPRPAADRFVRRGRSGRAAPTRSRARPRRPCSAGSSIAAVRPGCCSRARRSRRSRSSITGVLPTGTPPAALVALAAAAGMATPPLGACMRTLLPAIVSEPARLPALFAFESTALEITFVLGPPLALGLGAVWSMGAALASAGLLMLVSTLVFATRAASREWRPDRSAQRPRGGSLRSPAILMLALIELGCGVVFGATEVGITAAAKALGGTAAAGPLLGMWGLGSLFGGIAATRLGGGAQRAGGLIVLLTALAVAHGALIFATGSVLAIGAVILLAGATIAPTAASIYAMVDRFAPAGTATEAFSWVADGGLRPARPSGPRSEAGSCRARAPPRRSRSSAPPAPSLSSIAVFGSRPPRRRGRRAGRRPRPRRPTPTRPDQRSGNATPVSSSHASSRPSCTSGSEAAGWGGARSAVVEAAAADGGVGIAAGGQPDLRVRAQREIVRSTRAAHLRRHPARLDRVRERARPAPGDREREHQVEQLRVRVGLRPVPPPARPLHVGEIRVAAAVHPRAQVDEPVRRRRSARSAGTARAR